MGLTSKHLKDMVQLLLNSLKLALHLGKLLFFLGTVRESQDHVL